MSMLDPISALREAFSDAVLDAGEWHGDTFVTVATADLVAAAQYLRDTPGLGYNFLVDVVGIDYLQMPGHAGPRFGVLYHVYSMLTNRKLRLKVLVDEGEPVPSVTGLWPTANWQEREVYDMFGIEFSDHPDLRRILMTEDWDGHPQRKDYPLGYETVQFSFNFDEIQEHKPYAKE
ncbi:MAG: NADH-quinone oxidoreductase subunit C [Anaerolineae bacterium]|nr:NADH-quinone oxidoreductase subunit C [Anaerolineae bacterium]